MNKMQVTLDAAKLRNLVKSRSFENKEGETVQVQEIKFELVPLKNQKEVYKKDKLRLVKTHFAAAIQTKEEREQETPTFFIGDGLTLFWDNDEQQTQQPEQQTQKQSEEPPF